MKTLNLYAALLFSIFAINISFAQTAVKKETIKVWGNCGMCKKTIEKAAKSAGATTANWNEDSKELKFSYAVKKTSATKIQQSIAKSGYDTQDFTADDAAYNNLHGCCQYDRKTASVGDDAKGKGCCSKKTEAAMKCCDNEKCGKDADACKGMTCCKDKTCCKS